LALRIGGACGFGWGPHFKREHPRDLDTLLAEADDEIVLTKDYTTALVLFTATATIRGVNPDNILGQCL